MASGGLTLTVTALCAAALTAGLKVAFDRRMQPLPVMTIIHTATPPIDTYIPTPKSGPVDRPTIKAPPIEIIIPTPPDVKGGTIATQTPLDNSPLQYADTGPFVTTAPKLIDPVITAAGIDPKYRSAMQPPYPSVAMQLEQEGRVVLSVHIAADGHVLEADVKSTSGHSSLDEAARNYALTHWHLRPASSNGTPIDGWLTVPVVFHINQG